MTTTDYEKQIRQHLDDKIKAAMRLTRLSNHLGTTDKLPDLIKFKSIKTELTEVIALLTRIEKGVVN